MSNLFTRTQPSSRNYGVAILPVLWAVWFLLL